MFIAIKDTKLIAIHEIEWRCRKDAKGLSKSEYWTWLESVTSGDPPVPDYSGEDYEVKEITYLDKIPEIVLWISFMILGFISFRLYLQLNF